MIENKLLPCECKGRRKGLDIREFWGLYRVTCAVCGYNGDYALTGEEAVILWNDGIRHTLSFLNKLKRIFKNCRNCNYYYYNLSANSIICHHRIFDKNNKKACEFWKVEK